MSKAILIFGDTESSADLFAAVPLTIIDPFLYAEVDGRRIVVETVIERDRILDLDMGIEVLDQTDVGRDELIRSGLTYEQVSVEVAVNACKHLGITDAVVPAAFWVAVADRLREEGISVTVDAETFASRRRVKSGRLLEGIRRAQAAADAAMAEGALLVREARDGLTAEEVRAAMSAVCRDMGAKLPEDVIVAVGPQAALGHESGHGPINAGDHVLIDIWPIDSRSRCYADMTRTFMAGGADPPDELREYWRLTKEAFDASLAAVRPGVNGRAVYDAAAAVYEAGGQPTQRTKEPGTSLDQGFFHGLGHGVGLEVHEPPGLGLAGDDLVAGDVVTIEPGCYRPGFGGVRLEDLVLVTEDGAEVLTDFPYEL